MMTKLSIGTGALCCALFAVTTAQFPVPFTDPLWAHVGSSSYQCCDQYGNGYVRLTNTVRQSGGTYYNGKAVVRNVNLRFGFSVSSCSYGENAADGFSMTFQNVGLQPGLFAGGLGAGELNPSVSLYFDSYSETSPQRYDNSIWINGAWSQNPGRNDIRGTFPRLLGGGIFVVNFNYLEARNTAEWSIAEVATGIKASYSYSFGSQTMASILGGGSAYIGFTGGTGGYFCEHRIHGPIEYTPICPNNQPISNAAWTATPLAGRVDRWTVSCNPGYLGAPTEVYSSAFDCSLQGSYPICYLPTPSSTRTATGTPPPSGTATASYSMWPSDSGTPSNTATKSNTASSSMTRTGSVSISFSTSETKTGTTSSTETTSSTPSFSRTRTASSSETSSSTASASESRTNSFTSSGTGSPGATPSNTASNSASSTSSSTVTVSTSLSSTWSSTLTATVSISVSETSSGTTTASTTGSRTASRSTTPSNSGTASNSPTNSGTSTASLSFGISASSTTTSSDTPSATASNSSLPTTSRSFTSTPTASRSYSNTRTGSGTASSSESASITASFTRSPSMTATWSASSSESKSATPSERNAVLGNLGGDGGGSNFAADINRTVATSGSALGTSEDSSASKGSVAAVAAGAGLGGLFAILLLLCCCWWFLLVVPRRKKREEEAKKKLHRASFAVKAKVSALTKTKSGNFAAALGLPSSASTMPAGATASRLAATRKEGSARGAVLSTMFADYNPALLVAARGTSNGPQVASSFTVSTSRGTAVPLNRPSVSAQQSQATAAAMSSYSSLKSQVMKKTFSQTRSPGYYAEGDDDVEDEKPEMQIHAGELSTGGSAQARSVLSRKSGAGGALAASLSGTPAFASMSAPVKLDPRNRGGSSRRLLDVRGSSIRQLMDTIESDHGEHQQRAQL